MDLFDPIDFDLIQLLQAHDSLVFLVGAGISMDPPSSLPSARQMMIALIQFAVPVECQAPILAIPTLRYEYLIEIFRNAFDPALSILDYFELPQTPNFLHAFLAEMLKRGNWVLTTNFDYLIEHAYPYIDPHFYLVITPTDFEKYADPAAWFRQGTSLLYKMHGCTKNIKTGQPTKDSVVTTLSSLGKAKEGDIFSVETWKRPLFEHIGQDRTLIVLGYSGGDDFDIIPMLSRIPGLSRVIWIAHQSDTQIHFSAYRVKSKQSILSSPPPTFSTADHLAEVLYHLRLETSIPEILTMNIHTTTVFDAAGIIPNRVSANSNAIPDPIEWIRSKFPAPQQVSKEVFAASIFQNYGFLNDALSHYQIAADLYRASKDQRNMAYMLTQMGHLYRGLNQIPQAQQAYTSVLPIFEKLHLEEDAAWVAANMGLIHRAQQNYDKALKYNEQAYKIFTRLRNQQGMANTGLTIGYIFRDLGKLSKAISYMNAVLPIYETLGDLSNLAWTYANMGVVYRDMREKTKAIAHYEKALAIFRKLGLPEGITNTERALHDLT